MYFMDKETDGWHALSWWSARSKKENSHGWLGQMKTAAKNKTSERVSGVLPT